MTKIKVSYSELKEIAAGLGYPDLRPLQIKTLQSLAEGRDTLTIAPTSSGKSLSYQTMAKALNLVVVVSPLISLMQDQVIRANALGIPAIAVHSLMSGNAQRDAWILAKEGKVRLFYISPERLAMDSTIAGLNFLQPDLLVVDEAHEILEAQNNFRSEYANIGEARKELGFPLTLACTATANPASQIKISENLKLKKPAIHVGGFDRKNLFFGIRNIGSDYHVKSEIQEEIDLHKEGVLLVYFPTVKKLKEVFPDLVSSYPLKVYHGQQKKEERNEALQVFLNEKKCCILATAALGLGVDRNCVRTVLHIGMPGSLEDYFQEAGRAGRDGNLARCEILDYSGSSRIRNFFIKEADPKAKNQMYRQLQDVYNYLGAACQRKAILNYFGDTTPIIKRKDCCTGCRGY